MDFPSTDLSLKMIEWIETLKILGADTIFLYNLQVHPNVSQVLEYYVKSGIVDLTPLSLPGDQSNIPYLRHLYLKARLRNKRWNELIPYNDCLYRNMYRYKYIALLDIDEIIIPKNFSNWKEMMNQLEANKTSYVFRNTYFIDEMSFNKTVEDENIPSYFHMLNNVYRSVNYSGLTSAAKCFHDPQQIVLLHNHFPFECFGPCKWYFVDINKAQMNHYRVDCDKKFKNMTVQDTTIWKWKKRYHC